MTTEPEIGQGNAFSLKRTSIMRLTGLLLSLLGRKLVDATQPTGGQSWLAPAGRKTAGNKYVVR